MAGSFIFLHCLAVLVGENAVGEQHVVVWVCCPADLEGCPKLLEEVRPTAEEI